MNAHTTLQASSNFGTLGNREVQLLAFALRRLRTYSRGELSRAKRQGRAHLLPLLERELGDVSLLLQRMLREAQMRDLNLGSRGYQEAKEANAS